MEHVDNNCSEDEEEVDQDPGSQSCYAFSNLEDNCTTMMTDDLTEPQGSYLWLRLKELSKTGTMSPKVPFVQEQSEKINTEKNAKKTIDVLRCLTVLMKLIYLGRYQERPPGRNHAKETE